MQVELSQDANNVLTWKMNGSLIAQRANTSSFTSGNIMLGYMDLFSSIASPAQDAFILFDNVRVELASVPTLPVISAQPQPLAVYQGQDALFTVSATGSGTLNYQWLFEGSPIPGATSNSLTVTNVLPQNIGAYSVVVANGAGPVTSSNAALTLRDSPYVSGVAATPGQRAAIISWATTVPSDSRVQYGPGGNGSSFSSVSYTDHTARQPTT